MIIHNALSAIFPVIGCFKGTLKLQVIVGSSSYQALPRRVAYALQGPLCEELDKPQKQQIIVPLDADKVSEWCKSFVLVPKVNGKIRLCLELAWLNEVLIRTFHRGPTLNNVLPRLAVVKYLMFINMSSGYNNIKLYEQTSYLVTFSCPFGRYI